MAEKVRNEVRKQRFLNGEMTQEQLARRVGVTRQTIIAIEKGKYNPSVALALRIAHVLGLAVEEVFSLPDDSGAGGAGEDQKGEGDAR
jgi:putative transcriptional regulator